MHLRSFLGISLLGLALAACGSSRSAASCRFAGGFATLHSAIPTEVGDCKDNESYTAGGDAVQHTTHGVLTWHKADNQTAFTNGADTWALGPAGVQKVSGPPATQSTPAAPSSQPKPAAPVQSQTSRHAGNTGWLGLLGLLGLAGLWQPSRRFRQYLMTRVSGATTYRHLAAEPIVTARRSDDYAAPVVHADPLGSDPADQPTLRMRMPRAAGGAVPGSAAAVGGGGSNAHETQPTPGAVSH